MFFRNVGVLVFRVSRGDHPGADRSCGTGTGNAKIAAGFRIAQQEHLILRIIAADARPLFVPEALTRPVVHPRCQDRILLAGCERG